MSLDPSKPAFPLPEYTQLSALGITQRDYIAIEAMKALITKSVAGGILGAVYDSVPADAYALADLMVIQANK